ncbi:unnamed protein product [Rotaria sordida]|uniref:Uncharacterized protein n=1 Tax=Rotaria sordida TaxID=392033 RepID=A0A814BDT4_9BILA|nr:unnamed protein product [Rotaria sordida]
MMPGQKKTMTKGKYYILLCSCNLYIIKFIRKTNQTKGSALRSLLYGILLGSLLTGIALAAVLTLWLTSTQSTISPNSTITTTIITLITTTITTIQGTTLTESTPTNTTITTGKTI